MTWRIERLAAQHQRAGFDCGEPALNDFLQRQAGQMARRDLGKTYVALAEGDTRVLGYVTLSVGQIAATLLPPSLKLPRYPVPVLRLGRLAVDQSQQGQGVGVALMRFTLQLALEFAEQVGLYAVVVEAKHAQAQAFYLRLGFTPVLDDPLCLFLPVSVLKKL